MSKLEKTHVTKAKFMLHGGDYNPDQWLDRPDICRDLSAPSLSTVRIMYAIRSYFNSGNPQN